MSNVAEDLAMKSAAGARKPAQALAAATRARSAARGPETVRSTEPPQGLDWGRLVETLRPENAPGFLLWQATNSWARTMRAELSPLGLTHTQYVLLAGLGWLQSRDRQPVKQARLARFCKTDVMMTSQVVRTLEAAGLVTRRSHPSDRRARALVLTPEGVGRLNAAMDVVLAADRRLFGENVAEILGALRELCKRAEDSPGGPAPGGSAPGAR